MFFFRFWSSRGSSLAGLYSVDESEQITLFPLSQEKLQVILISSALCSPYLLPAATLGTLDFSLLYDQENNALHCTINKAKVSRRGGDANNDVSTRPWALSLMFLYDIFFSIPYVCSYIYLCALCCSNCDSDFKQTYTQRQTW